MGNMTPERLADLIMAEWSDKQSDSGSIWKRSFEALELAKEESGQELIEQAYKIAYDRWEALRW